MTAFPCFNAALRSLAQTFSRFLLIQTLSVPAVSVLKGRRRGLADLSVRPKFPSFLLREHCSWLSCCFLCIISRNPSCPVRGNPSGWSWSRLLLQTARPPPSRLSVWLLQRWLITAKLQVLVHKKVFYAGRLSGEPQNLWLMPPTVLLSVMWRRCTVERARIDPAARC